MRMMGKLYIVATPIGNLRDITFRAIQVLKSVDIILAEDTRHASRLLSHYHISTKVWSMHNFNEAAQSEKILTQLLAGQCFALISDAGTPLISDPGWLLVNMARDAGVDIIAVPGPCAFIAALSIAGLSTHSFHFFGFLPAKSSARQSLLKKMHAYSGTLIFYESPHRLLDMLKDCHCILGENRIYALVKEITKVFETVRLGSVTELIAWLHEAPEHVKGEFVVLIGAEAEKDDEKSSQSSAKELLQTLLPHLSLKTAVKIVGEHYSVSKNELYEFALKSDQLSTSS